MYNDQNCMQKSFKKVTGLVAKHFKKQCTQQCSSGAEVVLDSMASVNVVAAVAVASLTFSEKRNVGNLIYMPREGFQICEASRFYFLVRSRSHFASAEAALSSLCCHL